MELKASPSCLAQRFQSLVWACIDSDLTRTAVFYAERYFAMNQSCHDARHLYATALYRQGQVYSALCVFDRISREEQCSGCLELISKCCTALGRFRQATEALEESMRDPTYQQSSSSPSRIARQFPEEAALLCRAGTMALKGNLPEKAGANFRQALRINPLLWEAFEGLCALGSIPDLDSLMGPRPPPVKRGPADEPSPKPNSQTTAGAGFFTPDPVFSWKHDNQSQPFRIAMARDSIATNDSFANSVVNNTFQQHRTTRSQPTLPAAIQLSTSRPLSSAEESGPATKKIRRQPDISKSHRPVKSVDEPKPNPPRLAMPSSKGSNTTASTTAARRSSRLLTGTKTSSKATSRRRAPGRATSIESEMDDETGEPYSPSSPLAMLSPTSETPGTWTMSHEQSAQEAYDIELADHYIYELTRSFARATKALALYDSQKCISELESMPHVHQQSPWVLAMVGKAHYEKADYNSADRAFKAVRVLEPYRLWDMEVYSSLLWHLQKHVELSFLAQELLNIDPRSPQAWIAVGNLFSLQKDRSQALTCFRRAAQLDPSCAYAYTLSGHETIDEDVDKAINFFQSALRVDARHYNAWYGLGTCYLRMSKIRLAEYHYRKAVDIHPNNAVLLGCVGMAVERRGDRNLSLSLFDTAVAMAPDNALVRYRRAKILILMKKYEAAIKDLEYLRSSSPEESNVVFQLAKAYRLVGDETKSAQMLAVARDIAPKSVNKIKKLLETVKDEMVDDKMDEG